MDQLTLFDYAQIEADHRDELQQDTAEIKEEWEAVRKRTAEGVIKIGEKLIKWRDRLRHNKAGGFEGWISGEFGWSTKTAYNFINAFEAFGNRENITELDLSPSALYLLSAPSTPQSARDEALARAGAGEAVGPATAREIIAGHKEDTSEDPPKSLFRCKWWKCWPGNRENGFTVDSETMTCSRCGAKHIEISSGRALAPGEEARLEEEFRRRQASTPISQMFFCANCGHRAIIPIDKIETTACDACSAQGRWSEEAPESGSPVYSPIPDDMVLLVKVVARNDGMVRMKFVAGDGITLDEMDLHYADVPGKLEIYFEEVYEGVGGTIPEEEKVQEEAVPDWVM